MRCVHVSLYIISAVNVQFHPTFRRRRFWKMFEMLPNLNDITHCVGLNVKTFTTK